MLGRSALEGTTIKPVQAFHNRLAWANVAWSWHRLLFGAGVSECKQVRRAQA